MKRDIFTLNPDETREIRHFHLFGAIGGGAVRGAWRSTMIPALSIRQPWAWLILNAGKDIENRDWRTNFRGRVLIHASRSCTKAEYDDAIEFMGMRKLDHLGIAFPSIDELQRGGIVGSVEIVDCVESSDSPWFMGHFGFILRDPKPLPFVPCKGRLGFFNVEGIQL